HFQASASFSALSANTYTVSVKDSIGCTATASVNVSQPFAVDFTSSTAPVSCFGGNDGSIAITGSGGNGAYQYSKNNGATYQAGNIFSGLSAASYQVVVKDGNGCVSVPR